MRDQRLIRHLPRSDPPRFEVVASGGEAICSVPPADTFSVEGRPTSHLAAELGWYLERFLDYPFPPETERAERMLLALRRWGETAFKSLFGSEGPPQGGEVRIRLESEDPRVLSWPWEALYDPQTGSLGQWAHFERCLPHLDARPVSPGLPRDRLRILLVTARQADDATYRSISRPLLDLATEEGLPIHVHVLRPPSLEQLQAHLRQHPGSYHVLHFDGHGTYEKGSWNRVEGHLFFESDDGEAIRVPGSVLGRILESHPVPLVVLNACRSAMLDRSADNAFASVATSLLRAGVRSAVAMASSLYVSGAEVFLAAFYRSICETGNVAAAVKAGRRWMRESPGRLSARGRFPLEDWIVPVLYQNGETDFSFAPPAPEFRPRAEPFLGAPSRPPLGFVGRDGVLMELERAWRRPEAAIIVQGLAGVGKTALGREFVEWRRATEALSDGCVWIDFSDGDVTTADVLSRLGELVDDDPLPSLERARQIALLARALRQKESAVVWDSFERVTGIPGTTILPTLSERERTELRELIEQLHGGRTKVLVLSRGPASWLEPESTTLSIGGLQGEACWDFTERLFAETDASIDRADPASDDALDRWVGHPLALSAMLPRLAASESATSELLLSPVREFYEVSPETWSPLLWPLSLHERHVDKDFLVFMAQRLDPPWSRLEVEAVLIALTAGGLLRGFSEAGYEMHPILGEFLRSGLRENLPSRAREAGSRAFIAVISALAQRLSLMPVHDQQRSYSLYGGTIRRALSETEQLADVIEPRCALLQALAHHHQNEGRLSEAASLFTQMLELCRKQGDEEGVAAACHQLGMIAEEQKSMTAAGSWYEKSLEIKRRLDQTSSMAVTLHQLGRLAEEEGDLEEARRRYLEATEILETLGDERDVARSYHQLGNLCEKQGNPEEATTWYRKSLAIHESVDSNNEVATTLHQLGMVAAGRKDFTAAQSYYERALVTYKRLGNERGAAHGYHQLGNLAEARNDFDAAADWYKKALHVEERHGLLESQAKSYFQLGQVSKRLHDFEAAEQWYRKSLVQWEQMGRLRESLPSRLQLGRVARARGDLRSATGWAQDFLDRASELGDEPEVAVAYHELGRAAQEVGDFEAAERWYRKRLEVEERLGQEVGAAQALHQLGRVHEERDDLEAAERWYLRALEITESVRNEHDTAATLHQLGVVAQRRQDLRTASEWLGKAQALFMKLGDSAGLASVSTQLGLIAAVTGQPELAGQMFLQSVQLYRRSGNPAEARDNVSNFLLVWKNASEAEREVLQSLWEKTKLGPWPEEPEEVASLKVGDPE